MTLTPPKDEAQLVGNIRDLAAIYQPEATASPDHVASAYSEAARSRGEPDGVLAVWLAAYTDIVFRLRARQAAARHVAAGHPTYLYEFARPLAVPAHGVPHTSEIPFVFGTYADPFFAGKTGCDAGPLSAAMTQAWAAFARTGVPGEGWEAASAGLPMVNVLGGPGGLVEPRRDVRRG